MRVCREVTLLKRKGEKGRRKRWKEGEGMSFGMVIYREVKNEG